MGCLTEKEGGCGNYSLVLLCSSVKLLLFFVHSNRKGVHEN